MAEAILSNPFQRVRDGLLGYTDASPLERERVLRGEQKAIEARLSQKFPVLDLHRAIQKMPLAATRIPDIGQLATIDWQLENGLPYFAYTAGQGGNLEDLKRQIVAKFGKGRVYDPTTKLDLLVEQKYGIILEVPQEGDESALLELQEGLGTLVQRDHIRVLIINHSPFNLGGMPVIEEQLPESSKDPFWKRLLP